MHICTLKKYVYKPLIHDEMREFFKSSALNVNAACRLAPVSLDDRSVTTRAYLDTRVPESPVIPRHFCSALYMKTLR